MNKIKVLLPYFGKWPEWMDLFIFSLELNPTIDFLFYTDCEYQKYERKNIHFKAISFDNYIDKFNNYLGFKTNVLDAYKMCDLRPLFGEVHQEDFKGSDFYGWCDLDLLFGDIRSFYTDKVLNNHEVISSHNDRVAGHFSLFKNNEENRKLYKKIYHWKQALMNPKFVGIDEHGITNAYTNTIFDKLNDKFKLKIDNFVSRYLSKRKSKKLYFVEQYTTPFLSKPWLDGSLNGEQPENWCFEKGIITNQRDGERKFIYIHFMNFKSSKWRADNSKAPWEGKKSIYSVNNEDFQKKISINLKGISLHA